MNKIIKIKSIFALVLTLTVFMSACDNQRSYSDLLRDEQKASNWFLAQQTVCNEIPADSVFITGPDAPFYKMDPDGYIYMQVIKAEPKGQRVFPSIRDQVYFTFTRYDIAAMYISNTLNVVGDGNQEDFLHGDPSTYFLYNDYSVTVSSQWGSGIQTPVSYLGYNSEVNIVLKSYYGFEEPTVTCTPYLVNTRYFKAEY